MQKILLLSLLICFQSVFSQVSMEKNKLTKDGQVYKMSQYKEDFKNEEAQNYLKKARTNSTLGTIFAATGGALIGVSLPMVLKKKITNQVNGPYGPMYYLTQAPYGYGLLIGGVVLVGVGIPLAISSKKNAKRAIELENGESTAFQPYLKVETAGNGLALSYNF